MRALSKLLAGISLALALLFCMAAGSPACAYAVEETPVEKAQYGVVRVVCDGYGHGSGFAVGEAGSDAQYFVTNYHVIDADPYAMLIVTDNISNAVHADVIYFDMSIDLAILKTPLPVTSRHPLVLLSPTELNKSQDVFCLGFPGLMDDFSDREASSTISDITITKGSVSNPEYSFGGVTTILSDVKVNQGNSGGPMVDENGQAVGINTVFLGDGSGQNMTCAVSIDYVMEALDSLGLPYEVGQPGGTAAVEPPQEAEETPDPTAEASPNEPPAESPDATVPDAGSKKIGGTSWLLIYAVFVVAALSGTFLYLKLIKAKKHRAEEERIRGEAADHARREAERQRQAEEERIRRDTADRAGQEAERQRQAEEERIRRETADHAGQEAERQRQAEEERIRREGAVFFKPSVIEDGSGAAATTDGGTGGALKLSTPTAQTKPEAESPEFRSPSLKP